VSLFRRRSPELSADDLRRYVGRWLGQWPTLSRDEQEHLLALTTALVDGLRWEASHGFEVTADMQAAISAHAALLVLAFDDGLDSYLDVSSVIIHPSTIVRTGTRYVGGGLFSDGADPVIGEAHHQGPVLVSWDAAAEHAREPWRGESVLLHEFAHRLDMLDGISDGTPPIDSTLALDDWARVCTDSLRRLRRNEEPSVLRQYAATNPSEFFAVATEVFFTRPTALRDENPELYRVLRDYFRQDPARRRPMY
jgi:Mlc titration factor MtfA (ptsG expression regulator)